MSLFALCSTTLPSAQAQGDASHYERGDIISAKAFVTDREGSVITLRQLLDETGSKVNVLYIFGGGDMGSGGPGHLWCEDSFEDLHILRTLIAQYGDSDIGFIPVAAAPVYHTQMLGAPAGVFLNQPADSPDFVEARAAFVDSTMQAVDDGIIPIEPYFDISYRLKLHPNPDFRPGESFGDIADWMGAFRAEQETQFYGVPSLWLVSDQGEILADAFRGNIYHPHGADVVINYTFSDVDAAIQSLLSE